MHTLTGHAARAALAAVTLALLTACSGQREPATAEEKTARGDQLLRQMSDTLKNARALSFTVHESHERVRRNGEKRPYTLQREVVIRRPDRLWSHATGADRDVKMIYDGKTVTIIGDRHKIYAAVNAPATLDETLDRINDRFDLRVVVADFLYSSPYESFAGGDAKGGWRKRTVTNGHSCDELSYTMKAADVTLSVSSTAPVLPCKASIVYKEQPGQPVSTLVFSDWNLQAAPPDTRFVAQVPQGYEAIPIVERIPKTELKTDPAKAMGASARK